MRINGRETNINRHAHRAVGPSTTVGWTHCVADGPCSGRAHGAVTHLDRCSCGALRHTESNGRHVVRGPWVLEGEG